MALRLPILVLCLLVSASGCRRGAAVRGAAAQDSWTLLPPAVRLYYDNGGGIQDSLRLVVRSAEEFATVWRQATSLQSSPPPVPAVDFEREMVLVVGAGRMTPEDQIHVDSLGLRRTLDPDGETIQVFSAVVRVSEGCRRFQIDAYPVEIVRVRRFDGPVTFTERRETATDCRDAGADARGPGAPGPPTAFAAAPIRPARAR